MYQILERLIVNLLPFFKSIGKILVYPLYLFCKILHIIRKYVEFIKKLNFLFNII